MSVPRRVEMTTPADRLPALVEPEVRLPSSMLGEILERLDRIDQHLGIDSKPRKPFEPLPGSDVQPLSDEA